MPVLSRTRRKFRGLARSRIQAGIDFGTRLLAYNTKHPDKQLFTADDIAAMTVVLNSLNNALAATMPVS